jgi:hypothetical protein
MGKEKNTFRIIQVWIRNFYKPYQDSELFEKTDPDFKKIQYPVVRYNLKLNLKFTALTWLDL